jgi:Flp pilus assembly protein TadG
MVEFAVVAPLFILLVFAVVDFGRTFFVQMTLQDAVRQAGRFAITGNQLPDPNNPGQYLTRLASIIQVCEQAAANSGVNITNVQVISNGVSGNAGNAGAPVTVEVTTSLPLMTPVIAKFFPGGQYQFTVSATFLNEPFGST